MEPAPMSAGQPAQVPPIQPVQPVGVIQLGRMQPTEEAIQPGEVQPTVGAIKPAGGAIEPAAGAIEPAAGAIMPVPVQKGCNIALIDDDVVQRELYRLKFTQLGGQVVCFSSGVDFLERSGEHRFDAIVVDYYMPELNGVETVSRLADQLQEGCKVCVFSGRPLDKTNNTMVQNLGATFVMKNRATCNKIWRMMLPESSNVRKCSSCTRWKPLEDFSGGASPPPLRAAVLTGPVSGRATCDSCRPRKRREAANASSNKRMAINNLQLECEQLKVVVLNQTKEIVALRTELEIARGGKKPKEEGRVEIAGENSNSTAVAPQPALLPLATGHVQSLQAPSVPQPSAQLTQPVQAVQPSFSDVVPTFPASMQPGSMLHPNLVKPVMVEQQAYPAGSVVSVASGRGSTHVNATGWQSPFAAQPQPVAQMPQPVRHQPPTLLVPAVSQIPAVPQIPAPSQMQIPAVPQIPAPLPMQIPAVPQIPAPSQMQIPALGQHRPNPYNMILSLTPEELQEMMIDNDI